MVPVITQLLQFLFALVALSLGSRLRGRSRQAGRLCIAGAVVLLVAAAFELLWLTVVESVLGAGSLPRAIAGAFVVELIEAALEGAAWLLLVLAALTGRNHVPEAGR